MSLNYFIISKKKAIQRHMKKEYGLLTTAYSDLLLAVRYEKNIRSLAKLLKVKGLNTP